MNKIEVYKVCNEQGYNVYVDDVPKHFFRELRKVVNWLNENFAPPIQVRWVVKP